MEAEKTPEVRPPRTTPATPRPSQGPTARRAPNRRTMAGAGGFEAQSALLRPDPEDRAPERPAPKAGNTPTSRTGEAPLPRKATVHALEAKVMSQPQFLGTAVAVLRRGSEVTLLERVSPSWFRCRTPDGRQGFIHVNRVEPKTIQLRSGDTGSGTRRSRMDGGADEGETITGRG